MLFPMFSLLQLIPTPPLPGRTRCALLFSDFVKEKMIFLLV
jgi:hypothetical protein